MGPMVLRDPTQRTRVGAYLEDGRRLVWVLEVDHSGVLAEDVCSELLVQIEPRELMQLWRPVVPLAA